MRIGIDVGGTNTDAVLMRGDRVVAACKRSTAPDVTRGILDAISALESAHPFGAQDIDAIMVGTTHFINALIERRGLAPTAAVRLGLPATSSLPPFVGWPTELVEAIDGQGYLAHGGYEFDGSALADLDPDELRRIGDDIAARGIRSIAISSVFAPVNAAAEMAAADIFAAHLGPTVAISLSHEIGRIGLLERENATIINAALRDIADAILADLSESLHRRGWDAPLYLSQNDGTLMNLEQARRYPVATFASGPTNSMRGAALLSGMQTCAVVDIGGTTSDIGLLEGGFPRESRAEVHVAGVRTNFRMPDVISLGIGGGSRIRDDGRRIGPDSVGYRLPSEARVFGGTALTATDIAVAAGRGVVGDPNLVAHLDASVVRDALARIDEEIARGVDRMRVSADPLAVVAVGGGSILLPESLPGVGTILRPDNDAAANAVGAAIANVGGEVDRMYSTDRLSRDRIVEQARQEAINRAVLAGATADSVRIVEFDELPIPYLPGNAVRVRVKAVGVLDLGKEAPAHV